MLGHHTIVFKCLITGSHVRMVGAGKGSAARPPTWHSCAARSRRKINTVYVWRRKQAGTGVRSLGLTWREMSIVDEWNLNINANKACTTLTAASASQRRAKSLIGKRVSSQTGSWSSQRGSGWIGNCANSSIYFVLIIISPCFPLCCRGAHLAA